MQMILARGRHCCIQQSQIHLCWHPSDEWNHIAHMLFHCEELWGVILNGCVFVLVPQLQDNWQDLKRKTVGACLTGVHKLLDVQEGRCQPVRRPPHTAWQITQDWNCLYIHHTVLHIAYMLRIVLSTQMLKVLQFADVSCIYYAQKYTKTLNGECSNTRQVVSQEMEQRRLGGSLHNSSLVWPSIVRFNGPNGKDMLVGFFTSLNSDFIFRAESEDDGCAPIIRCVMCACKHCSRVM